MTIKLCKLWYSTQLLYQGIKKAIGKSKFFKQIDKSHQSRKPNSEVLVFGLLSSWGVDVLGAKAFAALTSIQSMC